MNPPPRKPSTTASTLLLAGIILYALNLRGPIVTLAPVIDLITTSLQITEATAGLLAGIPVFCFALTAPLAALLMRRAGPETAVTISLIAVLAGTIVRSADGTPTAFLGMVIIGLGITIGNITVPVIIGRDFPNTVSTVTGIYTAAMNVGSVLTTLGTAPLAHLIGWRLAIATWGTLAILALTIWRVATKQTQHETPQLNPNPAPTGRASKRWDAWTLMLAFGMQSFTYYGITAWLPTLLSDEQGLSAQASGASASTFQLFGIVGALGVPILLKRRAPIRYVSLLMTFLWFLLPLGLLLAPNLFIVWAACAGIAQGGNFTVILTLMVQRSRSYAESRGMSAFVQGVGYVLGALGPYAVGAIYGAAGNWSAPLMFTLGTLGAMGCAGFIVASAGPFKPATPRP